MACLFLEIGQDVYFIGGNFDSMAYIAKKALMRDFAVRNSDEFYKELEIEMLDKINNIGIGPQGFGGKTTALCANIEIIL